MIRRGGKTEDEVWTKIAVAGKRLVPSSKSWIVPTAWPCPPASFPLAQAPLSLQSYRRVTVTETDALVHPFE
jgi:hypothetical protein